ncbi:hypothetical protein D918_09908 [Trichuris suis]|nr:hypothetical protein D918_09908 [Trichuris suis]
MRFQNETAHEAVRALKSVHHSNYRIMTSAQLSVDYIDPASGDAPDWVRTFTKIPYSYTIELRPDHYRKGGFVLPESQIIPTGEEVQKYIFIAQPVGNASSACNLSPPFFQIYAGLKAMAERIVKNLKL